MKNLVATILLLALASASHAYVLNLRKWVYDPVASYDASGEAPCCMTPAELQSAISKGRQQWPLLRGGWGAPASADIKVGWRRLDPLTLGVTFTQWEEGGECLRCGTSAQIFEKIVDSSISFNNRLQWFTSKAACAFQPFPAVGAYDLRATAAHEFGHAIGLGHSLAARATMRAKLNECDFRSFPVKSDDRKAYKAVYKQQCSQGGSCEYLKVAFSVSSCKTNSTYGSSCPEWVDTVCDNWATGYGQGQGCGDSPAIIELPPVSIEPDGRGRLGLDTRASSCLTWDVVEKDGHLGCTTKGKGKEKFRDFKLDLYETYCYSVTRKTKADPGFDSPFCKKKLQGKKICTNIRYRLKKSQSGACPAQSPF